MADSALDAALAALPAASRAAVLDAVAVARAPGRHGDMPRWQAALDALPSGLAARLEPGARLVAASGASPDPAALSAALQALRPWRKGPLELFGVRIDTEWRSDWKWARVQPHLRPLAGRRVLDIGCGNGYYMLRMCEHEPAAILGVDPTLLFACQFDAIARYLPDLPMAMLPIGVEALPATAGFDTVFSMGVLYHRRDAPAHLEHLHALLAAGGELVLETLVLGDDARQVLVPEGRYAQMRNVWAVPPVGILLDWVRAAGFVDARCVDATTTTLDEQRATPWMTYRSLVDFLDPQDRSLTVEGHPAPRRAVVIARRA